MDELKKIAASWARSFLAAALATYLAVGWKPETILTSAIAAVAPVIIRYLNGKDHHFGRRV